MTISLGIDDVDGVEDIFVLISKGRTNRRCIASRQRRGKDLGAKSKITLDELFRSQKPRRQGAYRIGVDPGPVKLREDHTAESHPQMESPGTIER